MLCVGRQADVQGRLTCFGDWVVTRVSRGSIDINTPGIVVFGPDSDGDFCVHVAGGSFGYFKPNELTKAANSPAPVETIDLSSVREGKIQAIKAFRQVTGCGLKEAKDFVEAINEGMSGVYESGRRVLIERINALEEQRSSLRRNVARLDSLLNKALPKLTQDQLVGLLIDG